MKKYLPIYLYGAIIIIVGIFLSFSKNSSFQMINASVGISLIIGAIFAFVTAITRQRREVQFAYHAMHALVMIVYGISLIMLGDSIEKLILFTTFLFIFYALTEIIFCNWLFNLGRKVDFKIIAIRALLGLVIGVVTTVAMNYPDYIIQLFGAMFILVGINIILYVPVMKDSQEQINQPDK